MSHHLAVYAAEHSVVCKQDSQGDNVDDLRSSKVSPSGIDGLFCNERHQVKMGIELIGLCAGVGKEALLVQLFGDL